MPRIQGVDVPNNKATYVSLTYLFGIGRTKAIEICFALGIEPNRKANDLTEDEIAKINSHLENDHMIEQPPQSQLQSAPPHPSQAHDPQSLQH